MGYRLCKSTGVIHACGKEFKKVCKHSQNIKPDNYKDYLTKGEAEAEARASKKEPRYCQFCGFRDALQEEARR